MRYVVLVLAALVVFASCRHAGERTITYKNMTSFTLTVTSDGYDLFKVRPGEAKAALQRKQYLPDRVQAYDEGGKLRFDKTYTWEDLEANGFKIMLTENVTPTPIPR